MFSAMAEIVMKMSGHRCERCGHEWVPRGPRAENRPKGKAGESAKPRLCPKCKSPYWETAKQKAKGSK
jgi:uncharacterized protein with PIN domain